MSFQAQLDAHATRGPASVTVGTFDGVHTGHRALLRRVRELAGRKEGQQRGSAVAIVFRQQPRAVLQPGKQVKYIQPLEERLAMLSRAGLDAVVPVDFDPPLRSLSPREFVSELCGRLHMRHLVLGPGAAIGRDRSGDATALAALGREIGFKLHTVEPARHLGVVVSSSAIRVALAEGRLEDAEGMLGRRFVLHGRVEAGERRGRELGFPTANLAVDPRLVLPGDGIYAAWALVGDGPAGVDGAGPGERDQARLPAATSIGLRPTFGAGGRTVEAHLIGFDGDLYGRAVALEFVARLRDELKFASASALVEQMRADVARTRAVLGIA